MTIKSQIKTLIAGQPEPKRSDMQTLHALILKAMPRCKLWYFDGTDEKGETVFNPNIGYGSQTLKYADGKAKEFFQIGISPNSTGISVYIMGIEDRKYLPKTYGKNIGNASVTGYCIKFKALKDVSVEVLMTAVRYGVKLTKKK